MPEVSMTSAISASGLPGIGFGAGLADVGAAACLGASAAGFAASPA